MQLETDDYLALVGLFITSIVFYFITWSAYAGFCVILTFSLLFVLTIKKSYDSISEDK